MKKRLDLSEENQNLTLEGSENASGVPPSTSENDNSDEPTSSVTTTSGHSVRTPQNWWRSSESALILAKRGDPKL